MGASVTRDRVIEEIRHIPEHKLSEVYDLLHYFRVGLQTSKGNADRIVKFAGCWGDMPAETFREFTEEILERRKQAFSRRRTSETGAD